VKVTRYRGSDLAQGALKKPRMSGEDGSEDNYKPSEKSTRLNNLGKSESSFSQIDDQVGSFSHKSHTSIKSENRAKKKTRLEHSPVNS